ncbi:uncharacterized protein CC84DRAFT_1191449 [Paraphaeosphaeria sporulosa]|uniref:F-box domain-containing protein n=1 Tax=Paraphaeosphaeria sporulosa TaxID=1460663 RepID=A0A177BUY2_9PLEO|nr:uncharacterized protein CC84DRAFT_1191449 [Paraphaeosphaeria sporulosa]OAF98955.1 hypothetical protein CC84DRAFT_1191449 [Paraphaeosphaeria sporulosa]
MGLGASLAGSAESVCRKDVFPFLELPRELRDQIYDYAFNIPEDRADRALRIERRHLKYFRPSAASILLVLHHEYFLLNRQIAREALGLLFKNHTVYLSCGPYVLKQLLSRIEATGGPGKRWLKRIKRIELDWVTFPNLRIYPPERSEGKDEWYWEHDNHEVDVDYIRGAQYSGHYDEHDYEGGYYDDNFYEAEDASLYPTWPGRSTAAAAANPNDPFGFSTHYPFADPARPDAVTASDIDSKLDLLVSLEVTPLFDYLASPAFALNSITLPLYFLSRASQHQRTVSRPGYTLPLKIRYWVHNCIHALLMLRDSDTLQEVRVKYIPWDVWASMEPADDLRRMVEMGVWFRGSEEGSGEREGEGEAFRAVWAGLAGKGACNGDERMGLRAEVRFVKWEFDLDKRVGDELEVVFTKGVE